jgi:hypothetical protein
MFYDIDNDIIYDYKPKKIEKADGRVVMGGDIDLYILLELGFVPYTPPTYDPATQVVGAVVVSPELDSATSSVTDKSQGQLDTELTNKVITNITALWTAANQYQIERISGGALVLCDRLVRVDNAKGIAVDTWMWNHWSVYYQRKAAVSTGIDLTNELLDFTVSGDMPYSVNELMTELSVG